MPNCRSGYKNEEKSTSTAAISYHAFPLNDATRTSQWIRAIHREGFNPTANARVCSKHFCEADYRKSSCDADVTRVKNRAGAELKLKLLKDTAIPSMFPGQPKYMSGKPHKERSSTATAETRYKKQLDELNFLETALFEADKVSGIRLLC